MELGGMVLTVNRGVKVRLTWLQLLVYLTSPAMFLAGCRQDASPDRSKTDANRSRDSAVDESSEVALEPVGTSGGSVSLPAALVWGIQVQESPRRDSDIAKAIRLWVDTNRNMQRIDPDYATAGASQDPRGLSQPLCRLVLASSFVNDHECKHFVLRISNGLKLAFSANMERGRWEMDSVINLSSLDEGQYIATYDSLSRRESWLVVINHAPRLLVNFDQGALQHDIGHKGLPVTLEADDQDTIRLSWWVRAAQNQSKLSDPQATQSLFPRVPFSTYLPVAPECLRLILKLEDSFSMGTLGESSGRRDAFYYCIDVDPSMVDLPTTAPSVRLVPTPSECTASEGAANERAANERYRLRVWLPAEPSSDSTFKVSPAKRGRDSADASKPMAIDFEQVRPGLHVSELLRFELLDSEQIKAPQDLRAASRPARKRPDVVRRPVTDLLHWIDDIKRSLRTLRDVRLARRSEIRESRYDRDLKGASSPLITAIDGWTQTADDHSVVMLWRESSGEGTKAQESGRPLEYPAGLGLPADAQEYYFCIVLVED